MKLVNILLFILLTSNSFSQTCSGSWVTIDDETNKKKSIVDLYKANGYLYGRISYLYPREGREPNAKCTECSGNRKDEPLIGLQIVRGCKWDGSVWKSGTIVDPLDGKVYSVKIWLDPNNSDYLNVRGYIGPFYRTQKWVRVQDDETK